MRKGENIFKRKDGRWEARYIKGRDCTGKAKYGFCYGKSYKEAKEKVTKRKAELSSGKEPCAGKSNCRFAFYCEEWLSWRKNRVKESTYAKYDAVLRKHIKPLLGGYCLHNLSATVIDDFSVELLQDKKLSAKTVSDILVILRSVLRHAEQWHCSDIGAVKIQMPKKTRAEMRVLSVDEQTRFVALLHKKMDSCRFGVLFMLLSGIRIGELCALRWKNFDLEERTVRIEATLQRICNTAPDCERRTRIIISAPKSEKSMRTIPLTEYATSLCRRFTVQNEQAYILTGSEKYMEPRALQYRIEKFARECGLEGVHAHTLRHTFATRAVEVGFEIKTLSEILGHAQTTVTLERYVHSSMELKRCNMEKLKAIGL